MSYHQAGEPTMSLAIARIDIFPCKSLDGVQVERATLTTGGSLTNDRRWAIIDHQNNFVNAKRYAKIQAIRASFNLQESAVRLSAPGMTAGEWAMDDPQLAIWLSEYFQQTVRIIENTSTGFPDDTNAPGPTMISTATLAAVASWYPELSIDELRRRFRTNIEISGGTAFIEDSLFTNPPQPFKLGAIELLGINPCQRCIVPTRTALTGEVTPGFQKTFIQQRSATLPPTVNRSFFNHFYRLAVNTIIPQPQSGRETQVGDRCEVNI
jgi:uncharacterized protein